MSAPRSSLAAMLDDDERHALYRYRGARKKPPLYIGRTNNPMRCVGEHQRKQPWITKTVRIDVTWYYADEIAEAERLAIEREHPVYNITHNRGRVRIEAAAEVTMPEATGEGLVFMAALIARAGLRVEVPPARRGRCRCRPPTGGRAQPCASRRRRNPAAGAAR